MGKIREISGDLLGIEQGIVVHGCNCQGAMGAGVALAVRQRRSAVFAAYQSLHKSQGLKLGQAQICVSIGDGRADWARKHGDAIVSIPAGLVFVNGMTQWSYGRDVRQVDYDAISAVFARVRLLARDTGMPVYFPLIGCGNAGGAWAEVAPRIEAALGDQVQAILVREAKGAV